MKFLYNKLSFLMDFDKETINTLIIENPISYREIITELMEQADFPNEAFILSESLAQFDFNKSTEVINDISFLKIENNKKIISAITKELGEISNNELQQQFLELCSSTNEFINKIVEISNLDLMYDEINDISAILKLHNIRPDVSGYTLAEKLLLYMELCEKYLKKKLFIILNLHSYFTKEELDSLFKDMRYRKYYVLIIERYDVKTSIFEGKTIIDEDLCEI